MPCSFSGATTGVGSGSSPSSTPTAPTPLFGFGLNSTAAASGMWHGKFDSSIPMATGAWCPPYVVPCYEDAGARYTPYGFPSCGGSDSATNFSFDAEHVRYCGQQQQLPTPNYSAPVQQQQAEILAAAQAQAKEEAEISSRLPREVLNIHRRLDHQQLAVDALQGNLSKLTVMVEQIALAVNSSPSPATSPVLASSSEVTSPVGASPATSSASSLSSPVGASFVASTPTFAAISATSASTTPSAIAYVAPQVFGEMPIPNSWQGTYGIAANYCSGHCSLIQRSCEQGGSTNLSEQNMDGRPQPYGFHNLNRQSVFLADGTECSYFTLPADYPLEQTTPPMSHLAAEIVGASTPPSVAAQVACLAPGFCSKANNAAGSESMLLHNLQVPVPVQESPDLFKRMPVYDVYDEDTNASLNCAVELFDTVGQHKQYDVRFSKASDNTFSEEASTDLTFSHGHVIHAERSIKLTNEKSSQAASMLCVHEGNVHHNDERPEIDIKKQDVLTNKHDITSPCGLNNGKEVPFVLLYQLPRSSIPCIWDPGIDLFSYKQQHLFSWIPHSAMLLLQLLHDKNNSSMCEFSLEKGRQVQWDPGIEFILVELCWFSKGPGYILRHLLAVKFGTHSYTYFRDTAAIMCASPANLIQQRRTIAALFHFWQYKLLSSVVCTWDPGIGISSSIYHWLQSLTAANARPLSSLQTPEQATWLSQLTIASYVCDPGTVLLWYRSIRLLLFTEEKDMGRLIPDRLTLWCNAMHSCMSFQRCTAVSSLFHWNQDITFNGISFWLVTFNPP